MKKKLSEIKLVPMKEFRVGVARIISNTKKQSDAQIARLQLSNLRKRKAAKKRR